MKNEIKMFDFDNQSFRVLQIENEPWFVGNDVAKILGYQHIGNALIQNTDVEDRKSLAYKAFPDLRKALWNKKNDYSNKVLINESGLYSLILSSKLPSAKKFKHKVTSEVLPSIKKHQNGASVT